MSVPVLARPDIALGIAADAREIAAMSRDLIEDGLVWRWTTPRILRVMRDPSVNVAVARESGAISGFAIMQYKDDEAHLLLLAVSPSRRRRGVGRALMQWLEATALTAGTGLVYLEARRRNAVARTFYASLGYREVQIVDALYSGVEDGVRIARDLWAEPPSPPAAPD